jgi:PD-(D/E)XK nuclease superfamily
LGFLLDPRGNHGLGDAFVKRLLQRSLAAAGDVLVPLMPGQLEGWCLDWVSVQRESQYLDILLLDEEHEMAVIVENKVGADEHSDQLQRYHGLVSQHYPHLRIVGLYLIPNGETPSHGAYVPVS